LWAGLMMPPDLDDKAQAQAQATFNAMVVICFIICLIFLALLLVDESFPKAAVQLMSHFSRGKA
jgi:hypothetical protein